MGGGGQGEDKKDWRTIVIKGKAVHVCVFGKETCRREEKIRMIGDVYIKD